MGDHYTYLKDHIEAWLAKFSIFIVYIVIGIAVQIGMYDKTAKLTFWQRFWRAFVSICAGAIASFLCAAWKWDKVAMIIVPTTTLIGQSLFEYALIKWPLVADYFVDRWTKKTGK